MIVIDRRNIFNLEDPRYYHCYVERYQSNLHVLRIRAQRFANEFFPSHNDLELVFTSVLYFNGLLDWDGINVCLAEQEDCLRLFYETGIFKPDIDPEEVEENMEEYGLFVINTGPNTQVRFIASLHAYTMNVIQ
jgi:hypothetical protein